MKKGLLLILGIFLCVFDVNAETKEEALEILNKIPVTTENGVNYIDIKSLDPDLMLDENSCKITKEEIYNGDREYYDTLKEEELNKILEEAVIENEKNCRFNHYYGVFLLHF